MAVAQNPAFSNDGSISSVPDGKYMIWVQISFVDTFNEPNVTCKIETNGVALPSAVAQTNLKSGETVMPIVSAATLAGGGSTVEVDCTSSDNSAAASVNLSLVTALN